MNIAFIPARGGSKAIKLKNIKEFCGKPLIYWNLKALENSDNIDIIYVATDSSKIVEIVNSFKFSKVNIYIRDKENAKDTSATEDVMMEFLSKNCFDKKDIFLLVQATSPITQKEDFDNALKMMRNDEYDSLLTVVKEKRFFWNGDGTPINYDYKNRPRRQDFDGFLLENGAFYINTVENIMRDKNRLSGNIALYEMKDYTSIEIDEHLDWIIAEKYMKEYVISKSEKSKTKIKLFLSDVDGTLTDAGMYYDVNGNELKKFNTHDGKGFELLRSAGVKTGMITSENSKIVENRARKLKVDYLYQGLEHAGKLVIAKEICRKENIGLDEVAYIGDDINCKELLSSVGISACPSSSLIEIKEMSSIIKLTKAGGSGAVREFIELLIKENRI